MGNNFCRLNFNPESFEDSIIVRCRMHIAETKSTSKEVVDVFEEDLHTSRKLLNVCSPKFEPLLIGDAKNILVVDQFCSDDMSFFFRVAAVNAFPGDPKQFEVNLGKESIVRLLPIASFYGCESLWNQLLLLINSKPDLLLLVEAEKHNHGKSIDWNESTLDTVIDEILTKPKSFEKIEVKKGTFRHAERGDLATGMTIIPSKGEELKRLSSTTVSRIMQQMVKTKTNAHVDPPPAPKKKVKASKSNVTKEKTVKAEKAEKIVSN